MAPILVANIFFLAQNVKNSWLFVGKRL